MSIEQPTRPDASSMAPETSKSKPDKRDNSTHGEKKRKRKDAEDDPMSKSKKHKSHKKQHKPSTLEVPETISPFHLQTCSLYLPLAPVSQKHPLEGICAEHLSPLILQYYPPLKGVVISYSDVKLADKPYGDQGDTVLLQSIDEYAVSWVWVTADFLLFKPENGTWLEGYVNLQTDGHLGIVCWNLFSASIERKRLPPDWEWKDVSQMENAAEAGEGEVYAEEGAGYYVDGSGKKIEGMVKFRVKETESSHDRERGFLAIAGTMLTEEAEAALREEEQSATKGSRDSAGRRLGGSRALGATVLGVPVEKTEAEENERKSRQRY